MTRIWWCEWHLREGLRRGCPSSEHAGVAPDCRMVERILVTSPDSIIIERQDGEWPEEARVRLQAWIERNLSVGARATNEGKVEFLVNAPVNLATTCLDSLAEWSQSQAT